MDTPQLLSFVDRAWDTDIVPQLFDYIRIPCKSPAFDAAWATAGHIQRAVALIEGWCKAQPIEGLTVEVVQLEGRTPVIYMAIPGDGDDCVLLYGHLDKQPEMQGWSDGLGPWTPVLQGDRLYGRGGADDGYAAFAALTAIRALRAAGGRHARCAVIIEACEESGSFDLPFHIEALQARIGVPSLVICLDSGCGNYDQLWCTTSLRGLIAAELRVDVLTQGVHSGDASGLVPSSFRVFRNLLDRLEDSATGEIRDKRFHCKISKQRQQQARVAGKVLGDALLQRFPWAGATKPLVKDRTEQVLNRTWRPFLELIGADGVPAVGAAGSVLRPYTTGKLSLRLPPTADAAQCMSALEQLLTRKAPHGAEVAFVPGAACGGWDAPPLQPWLENACAKASQTFFGKPCVYMGEGGAIPFMGMLGARFPAAQFMITGVLGPQSNAHGPNEFLHIPMAKRLTACVATVLADHLERGDQPAAPARKPARQKTRPAAKGKKHGKGGKARHKGKGDAKAKAKKRKR
jgi:acetylornithine deacetylase/succinyl-diaminopimelate desuccinylase-like protein